MDYKVGDEVMETSNYTNTLGGHFRGVVIEANRNFLRVKLSEGVEYYHVDDISLIHPSWVKLIVKESA